MRYIDSIIVHCSASPDYLDIGAKEIDKWHKDRGWSGIGYHYVVRRNGEIERGRNVAMQGAHARGANQTSVGVCWVGTNQPSPEQYKSLIALINWLRGKFSIKVDMVMGHREAVRTDKSCPNIDMNKVRAESIFINTKPEVR